MFFSKAFLIRGVWLKQLIFQTFVYITLVWRDTLLGLFLWESFLFVLLQNKKKWLYCRQLWILLYTTTGTQVPSTLQCVMLYTVHNWVFGIFPKATSQRYNFLSGNFSKVGWGLQTAAIGAERYARTGRGPTVAAIEQTWEVAAWKISHLGSGHLGKYHWGPLGKMPLGKYLTSITTR